MLLPYLLGPILTSALTILKPLPTFTLFRTFILFIMSHLYVRIKSVSVVTPKQDLNIHLSYAIFVRECNHNLKGNILPNAVFKRPFSSLKSPHDIIMFQTSAHNLLDIVEIADLIIPIVRC